MYFAILCITTSGMSRAEAVAAHGGEGLDSACMMGINLGRDLLRWGVTVVDDWRTKIVPPCPSDEELAAMRICPT